MVGSEILLKNGIKPTKIRRAIAALLFDGEHKHVTVEQVIEMARKAKIKTSVASVYNTLNQFAAAGLLRRVSVGQSRAFFDTNLDTHHHFYFEDEDRLQDIDDANLALKSLPEVPEGRSIKAIEITLRV